MKNGRMASPLSDTSSQVNKSPSPSKDENINFGIGDKIYLTTAKKVGVVRFLGKTHFAAGIWVGVELPDPGGKNNGSIHGQKYFYCRPQHGLFVRPVGCTLVSDISSSDTIERLTQASSKSSESPSVTKAILRNGYGEVSASKSVGFADAKTKVQRRVTSPISERSEKLNNISPTSGTVGLLGRIESALTKPTTPPSKQSHPLLPTSNKSTTQANTSMTPASVTPPPAVTKKITVIGKDHRVHSQSHSQSPLKTQPISSRMPHFTPLSPSTLLPPGHTPPSYSNRRGSSPSIESSDDGSYMSYQHQHFGTRKTNSNTFSTIRENGNNLTTDGSSPLLLVELSEKIRSQIQEEFDTKLEKLSLELREKMQQALLLIATEATKNIEGRVDSLSTVLSQISSEVNHLSTKLETYTNLPPNPNPAYMATVEDLENQIVTLKRAFGVVASLTKEALDATAKERWDQSQLSSKLEARIQTLEHHVMKAS